MRTVLVVAEGAAGMDEQVAVVAVAPGLRLAIRGVADEAA
jgi:predicted peroxiredoxin